MTSTDKQTKQRMAVLQGKLDMLILRTLLYGPAHGHQIGKQFHGRRMTFCRCNTARSVRRCTGWSEEGWTTAATGMAIYDLVAVSR